MATVAPSDAFVPYGTFVWLFLAGLKGGFVTHLPGGGVKAVAGVGSTIPWRCAAPEVWHVDPAKPPFQPVRADFL